MTHHAGTVVHYIQAISIMALTGVVVIKLQTTPADVRESMLQEVSGLRLAVEEMNAIIDAHQAEFDARELRFQAIDNELSARTQDRIYRSEIDQWREEVQKLNPHLMVPELPAKR